MVLATFIDITKEEEQARLEYERKLDTIDLAPEGHPQADDGCPGDCGTFSVRQRQRPKQL